MNAESTTGATAAADGRPGCRLFLIVFAAVLAALAVAAVVLRLWLFPAALTPVDLKPAEKRTLNHKLQALGYQDQAFDVSSPDEDPVLQPQAYSEDDASREVRLSERELNGLLAKNTDLARKLAIDLSQDLASARLVLPLDPDLPFLGGQTLRISAGLEARFADGRPVMVLKGISLWGVPLPNAWLGQLKNVDLIREFGEQGGFWSAFAAGVDELSVRDGELYIRLKP